MRGNTSLCYSLIAANQLSLIIPNRDSKCQGFQQGTLSRESTSRNIQGTNRD